MKGKTETQRKIRHFPRYISHIITLELKQIYDLTHLILNEISVNRFEIICFVVVKSVYRDRLHVFSALRVDTLQATSMSRCLTVGFSGSCVPITSRVSSSWARTWCDSAIHTIPGIRATVCDSQQLRC